MMLAVSEPIQVHTHCCRGGCLLHTAAGMLQHPTRRTKAACPVPARRPLITCTGDNNVVAAWMLLQQQVTHTPQQQHAMLSNTPPAACFNTTLLSRIACLS